MLNPPNIGRNTWLLLLTNAVMTTIGGFRTVARDAGMNETRTGPVTLIEIPTPGGLHRQIWER